MSSFDKSVLSANAVKSSSLPLCWSVLNMRFCEVLTLGYSWGSTSCRGCEVLNSPTLDSGLFASN